MLTFKVSFQEHMHLVSFPDNATIDIVWDAILPVFPEIVELQKSHAVRRGVFWKARNYHGDANGLHGD